MKLKNNELNVIRSLTSSYSREDKQLRAYTCQYIHSYIHTYKTKILLLYTYVLAVSNEKCFSKVHFR